MPDISKYVISVKAFRWAICTVVSEWKAGVFCSGFMIAASVHTGRRVTISKRD